MTDRPRSAWACGRLAFVILLSIFGRAQAQTSTWSGATSGNWSDPLNWDSAGVPVSSASTVLQINAADPASFTATNDLGISPFVLNSFMLNSTSSAAITVLSPDPFQLAGIAPNITMTGSGAVVFQSSAATPGAIFDVANNMTIGGAGTGTLTIGGATDNNVFSGNGAVTVNFTTAGNATAPNLLLGDVANWNGALNIQSGYVKANRTAGDFLGESTIVTVAAGATLDMNNNGEGFGGLQGAGSVILGSAGLTFDATGDRTWTGSISGTGAVTQAGGGVFTMGGTNTFSGATNITSGTIRMASSNALSPNSAVAITAGQGTLDLNNTSQTIAGLAGGAPSTNLLLGASTTLTINGSGTGIRVFTGSLSGAGNLAIGGTATQVLLGNNTYTGTTSINGGILRLNGNSLQLSSAVSIAAGATLDASFANDAPWTTPLSGTGNFIKSGSGVVTFAAANPAANFASVTVNDGGMILDYASNNSVKLGANPALILGSGALSLLGNSSASTVQSFNGLTLTGGGKINLTSGLNQNASIALGDLTRRIGSTIDFHLANTGTGISSINTNAQNNANGILGGYATFNGTDWATTGTGAGPFNVAPLAAASYTSNTWSTGTHTDVISSFALVNAGSTGSVRFNTPGASTLTLIGSTGISTGGILVTPNVGANTSTITAGSLTAPAGQELFIQQFNPAGNLAIASAITNTANSTSQTIPTITTSTTIGGLSSTANLYPGMLVTGTGIAANARILSINSPTSITLTAAPAAGTDITLTFNGGTVVNKSGPGTLILSGANTFTGALNLNEGVVSVGVIGNIGANSTNIASNSVVFNGGTLRMTGSIAPGSGIQPWIIGPLGGTVDVVGANTTASKQGNSVFGSGTLTKIGDGAFSVGSNVSAFNGLIDVNQGTIRLTSNQLRNSTGMTIENGAQLYILDTLNGPFGLAANASLVLNGDGPGGGGAYRHGLDEAGSSNFGYSSSVYLESNSRLTVTTDGTTNNRTSSDTNTDTFTGPISGPGNLIKDGNGTLVLSNAFNSYGGPNGSTIISNGTLRIGGANRLPLATTVQFGETGSTNSGVFDLNGFDQTIAGLTTAGSGAAHQVINSGLNASTITVNYNGASPQTFAGQIGDTFSSNAINFVKSGSGTLSLSAASSYTGTTAVNAGTLRVFANSVNRPYTVSNGAGLSFVNTDPNTSFSVSSLTLGTTGPSNLGFEFQNGTPTGGLANIFDFNGLTANGNVNVSVASLQTLSVGQFPLLKYNGSIQGNGFAAFSGGTLTLPSRVLGQLVDDTANSSIDLKVLGVDFIKWTGATNGDWNINQTQNWKLNSTGVATTYLESPAPGDTVLFDETAGGSHTVNLTTSLTPSAVTVSGPSNYTFTGSGKLSGTAGLTKSGSGTLTVLTNNINTGVTTINEGTLQIGNGGTTGALGSGSLVNNGQVVFNRSDDVTFAGNLTGSGGLTKNGAGTLALTGGFSLTGDTALSAGTLSLAGGNYSGNITGAGALLKTSVGTLALSGNAAHTGGTTISGGILQIGSGGTTGSLAGNVSIASGATLDFNRADDSTFAGNLSGAGGISNDGFGKTTLTGALTYTGGTSIVSGTVELSSNADTTLNGKVSGAGTLIKSGTGQLTLLNNNPFTGPLIVNQGTVLLDDLGLGGDLNSTSITINNGGKFIFGANGNADFPDATFITVNGGEFEIKQGENFGGIRLQSGTIRLTGNNAADSMTMTNASGPFSGYALESGTIIAADTGTGTGALNVTANLGLAINKTTPGTVTFSGKVALQAALPVNIFEGALEFDSTNIPASGSGTISLGDFNSTTGIFRLIGVTPATTSRPFAVNAGGGALDVADPAGSLTLTTPVNGFGTLSKTGPGTLSMPPSSGFSGTTAINAGTLRTSPGLAAGPYTIANGAKLVIVNGASPDTLSVPSLTLGSGSSAIAFELNSTGNPFAPLLSVTNPDSLITSGGNHLLTLSNTQPLSVGEFPLISYSGAPITSGFTLGTLPSRTAANLVYNTANSTIDVNITGFDSTLWNGNLSANWDAGSAVDIGGTKNFKLASNSASTNFFTGDRVTFDDTATGNFTVNLQGPLQPSSVTVNNNANTYTFQGPGSLTGAASLTKQGSGTLVVSIDNNYTGPTSIAGGTLQIGSGGATGSIASNIDIASGATLAFNRSDSFAYNAKLSGSGDITKTGPGTLTLGGSSTAYFGTMTINQGTVLLDDLGAGGDLNAVSIVVNNGGSFVFGENGNADLPDATVVTINSGGVFDLKQGENFGGIVLNGGTFQMTGGTRTGTNATAAGSIGYILQSGIITTNFTGAATGGVLGGTTFVNKTTPGTVNITAGVTFADTVSLNILEGTLAMGVANVPATGTTSITLGDFATTGTLKITDAGAVSTIRPIALGDGGGTVEIADPAGLLTFAGPVTGGGIAKLTKTGAGTLALSGANAYFGPTEVKAGTLRVTSSIAGSSSVTVSGTGTLEAASTQTLNNLSVTDTGKLVVAATAAASPRTVVTITGDGPSITGSGTIDLRNNAMVVDYNGASPLANIRTLIINGHTNGWNAGPLPSIGSTQAAASSGNLAIGYAEASALHLSGTFMGQTVDDTSVVIRMTLAGDSNLDGTVGFADLVAVAQHYGQSDGNATWNIGDFNYDGNVGFADLVAVAQHYGAGLPSSPIPGASLSFEADAAAAFAGVPEPSDAFILMIAAGILLMRKPSRQSDL